MRGVNYATGSDVRRYALNAQVKLYALTTLILNRASRPAVCRRKNPERDCSLRSAALRMTVGGPAEFASRVRGGILLPQGEIRMTAKDSE